jgi:dipeptidyl aminopeptidase/acylaminoacyl peptidase
MKTLVVALLTFSSAGIALAQQPGFTLEQVMSSPFPTELTAASSANRIAWVFNSRGERNVWIADSPGFEARQVTHYTGDDGQDILSLRLTPDGTTLVFARGSEVSREGYVADPAGDLSQPKQQVWAADVATGKLRLLGDMGCTEEDCEDIQLSPDGRWAVWQGGKHHLWIVPVNGDKPARQLTELRGEESQPQWAPDGSRLAFVINRRDHSFVALLDFAPDMAPQRVRYISPSVDRDFAPRWSPDGKQLVFIRAAGAENHLPMIPVRPRPWAIWLANPGNAEAHELWHSGKEMNDSLPPFAAESLKFAAGGKVVFCSEQDGWNHLYVVSVSGGQPGLLTPHWVDTPEFEVEEVSLTADKKGILYTHNLDDPEGRRIKWIPELVEWNADAKYHRHIGGEDHFLAPWSIHWRPIMMSDGNIVCFGSTAHSPAMPYHYAAGGWQMIAPAALPKDFPTSQLVKPQTVTFKSEDGIEIHGQLFVPGATGAWDLARLLSPDTISRLPEVKVKPRPALIFVHGGPRRQMMPGFHPLYYYHNAYAENQYLASLGYVVLSVNYRLGIMYGRSFREASKGGWRGSSEYKDVVAGARYLQSLPNVDPKRIGIWGGSYGGLLTALALARNSDIFAAGVDFHGVHDWSMLIGLRQSGAEDAPDYREAQKLAFDSSPVAAVSTWKSPVLLLHGDDDRNVPFQQTTDLVQRLREQGVKFEEIVFPDEIHDFLLWKTWVRGYQATADFFNQQIGSGH